MSKWTSRPDNERPKGQDTTSQVKYLELQVRNYNSGRFADLGILFSASFSGSVRKRHATFEYTDSAVLNAGEVVDEPPTGDAERPPGELGRAALAMSTAEIADALMKKL